MAEKLKFVLDRSRSLLKVQVEHSTMPLNSSTQAGWIYKLQRYKILNAIMDDFFFLWRVELEDIAQT